MVLQDSPTAEDSKMDLELLDLAVTESGAFIVLVSYAGKEDSGNLRRLYALVQLELVGKFFTVHHVKPVPYQNLKSVADRTLGVGVHQGNNTLLILTASTMMQVQLSLDKIRRFNPQTGRTNLIKSIMMQAILYGAFPENPLQFSFPPQVDEESLMRGAEQLSQAVLKSGRRKDRLNWLIGFINENLVLGKMSQRSRQRLAVDAEKLFAAYQLWLQYNDLLETSPKFSVLNDCVHAFMAELGETNHEDVMRAFFRTKVSDIGRLVRKVMEVITLSSKQTERPIASLLPEGNRVVITALQSAFEYRNLNYQVYGIEFPMISSWTSRPGTIDVVLSLFNATTKVLENVAADARPKAQRQEPGSQLPQLANLLFKCVKERLEWLSSSKAADEPNVGQDKDELEQRFASLRPEVLETLRRNGFQEHAFKLAEVYSDFASLVALCHRDTVYPPENNPNYERIQTYIGRYKENFTEELYQWYIQHGELRIMFNQEADQSLFIDRFFSKKPNPGISWLHDVSKERFGDAASALLEEAKRANHLKAKHLMLSIGKLAQLAQLHESAEAGNETQLDAFHDGLDFVSVHDALLTEFRTALESVRGRHSLESQVDIIIKAKAPELLEAKGFANCFKDLLKHLLQGKALPIEDAVDLLTLKDNSESIADFATALHLLASASDIPEARRVSAFRTVWRRVYLHDDWTAIGKTANVSDAEIKDRLRSTALYHTLCSALARGERLTNGYEASPDVALIVPTAAEISSRWSGISSDQVDAIVEDYNFECDRLGELELEDIFHRVRELAVQDTTW
ncbi:hypothetical protein EST38_g4970 [Candolleomyces aberdarensis]|uniref:Nucleoporin Nup133/Nup155-like C-terminal domain-containing protein n=1 Tax=Candolleomyces aberdarensis TaxID=2316362 RepID=A0A4Q2DLP2_9AGAR|nr:hypothetical protein EST38_g4970 [Candolleomyces aberdarensis]